MPLVYHALESENPVVLEKALRVVPGLCETLDYTVRARHCPRAWVACLINSSDTDDQTNRVSPDPDRLQQDHTTLSQGQVSQTLLLRIRSRTR